MRAGHASFEPPPCAAVDVGDQGARLGVGGGGGGEVKIEALARGGVRDVGDVAKDVDGSRRGGDGRANGGLGEVLRVGVWEGEGGKEG